MSKMSIAWHEECLVNARRHALILRKEADLAMERACKANDSVTHLEAQISVAKQRGLDGFDPNRLLNRRHKSS